MLSDANDMLGVMDFRIWTQEAAEISLRRFTEQTVKVELEGSLGPLSMV